MQKVQRILEPPGDRGDPTCFVGASSVGAGAVPMLGEWPVLVVRYAVSIPCGTHFEIKGRRAVLVRSSSCDFVVREQDFSRRHLDVFAGPGGQWFVADQRSTNGSFVNRRRLEPLSDTAVRGRRHPLCECDAAVP